ncbi:MAG TPA: hypothetical protein VJ696_10455 [Rhodanobacteraceae bacterium]|nr:hypothetical protein [Rhodanobacteraceae bacterium]
MRRRKSHSPARSLRVVKHAERDVEDRQVGMVVAMAAARVMPRMAFRPLHEIAEPWRRAHVRMLEDRQQRDRE